MRHRHAAKDADRGQATRLRGVDRGQIIETRRPAGIDCEMSRPVGFDYVPVLGKAGSRQR